VKRRFFGLQSINEYFNSVKCQLVGDLCSKHPVMTNTTVEFETLLTHGSPRSVGREREALSVTDKSREWVDDVANDIGYVRFRTDSPYCVEMGLTKRVPLQFNATVDHRTGFRDRLIIVRASQRLKPDEVAVTRERRRKPFQLAGPCGERQILMRIKTNAELGSDSASGSH
jgi:hypothetical protein